MVNFFRIFGIWLRVPARLGEAVSRRSSLVARISFLDKITALTRIFRHGINTDWHPSSLCFVGAGCFCWAWCSWRILLFKRAHSTSLRTCLIAGFICAHRVVKRKSPHFKLGKKHGFLGRVFRISYFAVGVIDSRFILARATAQRTQPNQQSLPNHFG